jgi:hypothetical protein
MLDEYSQKPAIIGMRIFRHFPRMLPTDSHGWSKLPPVYQIFYKKYVAQVAGSLSRLFHPAQKRPLTGGTDS